jgi:hypothetical protein
MTTASTLAAQHPRRQEMAAIIARHPTFIRGCLYAAMIVLVLVLVEMIG